MLATLSISIAAGLGFAIVAPDGPKSFTAMAACVVMGLLANGWLACDAAGRPRVESFCLMFHRLQCSSCLPVKVRSTGPLWYRQQQHGRPLINGYSGHTPPHYAIFSLALRRGDPSAIMELARGRPIIISVNQSVPMLDGSMDSSYRGLPGHRITRGFKRRRSVRAAGASSRARRTIWRPVAVIDTRERPRCDRARFRRAAHRPNDRISARSHYRELDH